LPTTCCERDLVEYKVALPVLDKTDSSRLFTETLTAKVKSILADETGLVGAEPALTATLSEFARAREPNSVVGHFL